MRRSTGSRIYFDYAFCLILVLRPRHSKVILVILYKYSKYVSLFLGIPHILSNYIVRQKREIVSYIDAPYVRNTSLYFRKRGVAQKHHVTLNRVYEDIRCLGERLKSLNFNNQQAANRLFKGKLIQEKK